MADRPKIITLQGPKWPQRPKVIRDQGEPVWFRWVLSLAGVIVLLAATLLTPPQPDQLWYLLLIGLFIAFQVVFPLNLLSSEANLTHAVTLGGGLLFGPVVACWAATLGMALGYGVRWFESRKWGQTPLPPPMPGLDALAMMGMHHIAMLVALPVFGFRQAASFELSVQMVVWGKTAPALLLFAALHTLLFLSNALILRRKQESIRRDLLYLTLMEILPLPLVWISVLSFPVFGLGALVLLGGVPLILEMLFYGAYSIRRDLRRRSQELDTLHQISQALRSTLDLEQLLEEIQNQVSQLFAVENFYIALYNPDEEQLWYPLAVKRHQRVYWAPRPLTDRLTDRVIRERAAILLPHNARDALAQVGLPAGQDSPTAWMGVPLISSDRVIGCLGVFSFSPEALFTRADVRWLTTLSGQVSIAIENALHYHQAQHRADLALNQPVHQLEMLQVVGQELATAIRSDRLMDVILGYALQVTGSTWGSITMYDSTDHLMVVKALRGYQKAIASLSAEHGITGKSARTGQRLYLPDVSQDPDYVDLTGGAARSQLCVPLIHEERVLGVLTIESAQVNAYSSSNQAFVNHLAAQATIALVNAELYAQAQERLSELAAVLNSVGEGLLVIDGLGKITLANESVRTLTGMQLTEFAGKCLSDLSEAALACLGFNREQSEQLLSALGQGQVPASARAVIRLGEGTQEKILERASFPVWDRRGRVTGWMVVLRNITEEVQVSRAKELITETLVHDLRSPASAVLGALDVLNETISKDELGSDEVVVQALQVARHAAERMLGMTESLLEIARLQSGRAEAKLTSIKLRTLAANVVNDFMPQSVEYGIILRNEIPEDAPSVQGDLSKTRRVLTNLIDNALKFTPSGGQVILTTECLENQMIAVQVSDTGPGVPEEYREKIFERFSQVPGIVGRRRGSGLGLTFCRLALEAQGGKIWVEPRPSGGCKFVFTLPAVQSSG